MENHLTAPATQTQAMPQKPAGPSVETLVQWVDEAEEASHEARKLGETCRRYYHNKQLTAEEKKVLRERGQPEMMENIIRRKIKFLKGWEKQTRSDPKAFPRNAPEDEEAAEAATDALRFQEQAQFLDQTLSYVWEDMLLTGYGGVEVLGPNAVDPKLIDVKLWRWDRLGYDPHSAMPDFSDAKYVYTVTWMDRDDAEALWPEAKQAIAATVHAEIGLNGKTYDDKPTWKAWASRASRERVKIIQLYYRDGHPGLPGFGWHWCVFTRGGKLDSGPVELIDQMGKPECPLLLQSAYVDDENNRYGEVVEMLTMQDAVNKTHSKLVHLMNSRQTMAEEGALLDPDAFKQQLARPDGHIKLQPGALEGKRFQIIEHSVDVAAHSARLESLRGRFEMMGPNAALQGKQGQSASGRAIRASQEGGLIELADIKDEHTHLKRRVYRALWNRIRQFWTEETWVRVTDNDDNVRFVGFNRPVTAYEDMLEQAEKEGIEEDEAKSRIKQAVTVNPLLRQQMEQVVRIANVPAETDVDIIVDVASEAINLQEETFQTLAGMFPPGMLPPEVVLELAPVSPKKKRQIKEMLKPDPKAQQRDEAGILMKAENLAADTEQKQARALKDRAAAGVSAVEAMAPQVPVDQQDQQFIQ
jgi:hypothetical protein